MIPAFGHRMHHVNIRKPQRKGDSAGLDVDWTFLDVDAAVHMWCGAAVLHHEFQEGFSLDIFGRPEVCLLQILTYHSICKKLPDKTHGTAIGLPINWGGARGVN